MKRANRSIICFLAFLLPIVTASAESNGGKKVALVTKVGTLGVGIDLIKPITSNLDIQASLNHLGLSRTISLRKVKYKSDINLQTVELKTNWHPQESNFFVSAGVAFNNSTIKAKGVKANRVTVGNNTFFGNSRFDLNIKFDPVSPYLGLGYRKKAFKKGLSFIAEAGVLLHSPPKISLSIEAPEAANLTQNDVLIERQRIQRDLRSLENWPVLSVGVSYQF